MIRVILSYTQVILSPCHLKLKIQQLSVGQQEDYLQVTLYWHRPVVIT